MRINTFTPIKYRNCPIYIRQFANGRGDEFEYSTIINNALYTFQASFRLKGWRAVVGFFKSQPFSEAELKRAVGYMEKAAQATIDTVLGTVEVKKSHVKQEGEPVLSPLQIKQ